MHVRLRIDELIRQRGWNAARLAKESGLDHKTVRNIIAHRASRLDLATIGRLADALNVQPGAIFSSDRDPMEAWRRSAGCAGPATPEEIEAALRGAWGPETDPALERATRP